MAISTGLGVSRLPSLSLRYSLRYPLRYCALQVRLAYAASVEAFDDTENDKAFDGLSSSNSCRKDWKKLKSEDLGIKTSKISRPIRVVLNGLRKGGFEVYLVGGCVRDLILERVPKDFDIITSAELKDVMRTFSRCEMVGRRFPICHVHIDDTMVEVSSFSTRATRFGRFLSSDPEKPAGCDDKDYARWRNCLQRDLTINGSPRYPITLFKLLELFARVFPLFCFSFLYLSLNSCYAKSSFVWLKLYYSVCDVTCIMLSSSILLYIPYLLIYFFIFYFFIFFRLMFDPYAKLVYDYVGGVNDIRKAKIRTIKPANLSLTEDCARILRAVRIAARLDFKFSRETALAVRRLSATVLRLDRGRLLMEVNYMLAYGSAEASLRLLWKLGLLEILLPIQAAYFVSNGFRRRDKRYNMLLSLFFNLDKLLAPDRPCHSSLWFAILAFHEALWGQPRDPLVVAVFSLAVHNGGDLSEAVSIARRINKQHDISFDELLKPKYMESDELLDEVRDLADSVRSALHRMTDEYFVSQAMAKYPKAPYSDLVIFPMALYLRVCKMFECVGRGREKGFTPKHGSKIDYELLAMGSLKEIRHAFARVVFDTIYPIDKYIND